VLREDYSIEIADSDVVGDEHTGEKNQILALVFISANF
jgi:hypothetical protein